MHQKREIFVSEPTNTDSVNQQTPKTDTIAETNNGVKEVVLTAPVAMPFGSELSKARKQKVLSIDDVARELNILKRHVQAMEEENYDGLPPKAFARGFVYNYARFVGLDGDEMVRRFEAGHPIKEEVIKPLQKIGNTVERGGSRKIHINFGLIAGIIAVLVFGVAILKMISGAKKSSDITQTAVVSDSLSPAEQAQGAAVASSGSALGATGSALATGEVITNGIVDFWVKEPTTITVKDGKGAVLMDGNQNRGGYQITGQSPFSVEIADPDKVDLSFNHQKVDLSEHRQGNKAVLTLQ